jgi:putative membrane protein
MNRIFMIAAATAVLLSAPSLAETVGEKSGINAALGIAPTTQDFVTQAAISDMFEIESGKLADQKAAAAAKNFGSKMVTDHTKTSDELKALVEDGSPKVKLPTALDSAHQSKLDELKKAEGDDFTETYADMQVEAHENAVSLFERYAEGGEDADLKAWAGKTLPHLKHHLAMAQDLENKVAN